MTLDLVFVGAGTGRAALAQLTADLGVRVRIIADRLTTMEIFPVSVLTVEVDADLSVLDAVARWFSAHGILQRAAAAA